MADDPITNVREAILDKNLGAAILYLDKLEEITKRRKRILELTHEAMAQLRLDVKYLIFDLECTRKELEELKSK